MSCNNVIATVVVISAGHTIRQRETLKILRGGGKWGKCVGAGRAKQRGARSGGGEKRRRVNVAGTTSGRKQLVLEVGICAVFSVD